MTLDPVSLATALLRCRSVTPADGGAQAVLAAALREAGFTVTPLRFGAIENFYAERGACGPHLCFAGHTDVVPAGGDGWRDDPFGGVVRDGMLYGRGACDMKGAIAAFAAAAAAPCPGTLSLLITGDEEGEATDGTVRVLQWMEANGKRPDFCVVGEPTSQVQLGDAMKIGRRGSLNARITVTGRQGHAAYPQLADNPVHRLIAALADLTTQRLDAGTADFEPSSLQVTSVDVGNPASNIIPAQASARLNIRFNNLHDEVRLTAWLRDTLARHAPHTDLAVHCSGAAFLTATGAGTGQLAAAITAVTGLTPSAGTGGGTSDARFIAGYFPVAEFGLVGATMHQENEAVPVASLHQLAAIYRRLIENFCR